jgi:hypothetical protein
MSQKAIQVGAPNETVKIRGEAKQIRDELGLPLDPAVWAKAGCDHCYGRGTETIKRLGVERVYACRCSAKRYARAKVLFEGAAKEDAVWAVSDDQRYAVYETEPYLFAVALPQAEPAEVP